MTSSDQLKILFPMSAFGIVHGPLRRIRVNRLEQRLTPAVPFPHKHSFFHLLFLTQGSGWHEIDFRRWKVFPGLLFLMRPAQVHAWMLSPDSRGYIVEFEVPEALGNDPSLQFLRDFLNEADNVYDLRALFSGSRRLLRAMLVEHEQQETHYEEMIQALLLQLLISMTRLGLHTENPARPRNDLELRFKNLIEKYFREHHDVAFYARELNLSAKALTMRMSRLSGRSARGYIQDRCLLEAKRLLAYSDWDISHISQSTGFADPSYFARIFKEKTSYSPRAFRAHTRRLS